MEAGFGEMLDTSPEQRRRYYDLLRSLTVEQRARKLSGLSDMVRTMALAAIRAEHPAAGPEELAHRLAERLYGAEIATRIFGRR